MKVIFWKKKQDLVNYLKSYLEKNNYFGDVFNLEKWNIEIPLGFTSQHLPVYLKREEDKFVIIIHDSIWMSAVYRGYSVEELVNYIIYKLHIIKSMGV